MLIYAVFIRRRVEKLFFIQSLCGDGYKNSFSILSPYGERIENGASYSPFRGLGGRDIDEMRTGAKGCGVGEGLKWRAAVFRRYKNGKPDPRYEGHPKKEESKKVRKKKVRK